MTGQRSKREKACSKCGAADATSRPRYCVGCTRAQEFNLGEHLHHGCQICGYTFITPTADAAAMLPDGRALWQAFTEWLAADYERIARLTGEYPCATSGSGPSTGCGASTGTTDDGATQSATDATAPTASTSTSDHSIPRADEQVNEVDG